MAHAIHLVVFCVFAVAPKPADDPFKHLTFDAACKTAADDKKIVLIDFFTTWCGPCKMLDRETWSDADVQKWLDKNTVALKVDAEKEADLARKFKIQGYPTILLLKPDGTEIDRIVGFRPPDVFLEEAKGAISGKDSVARAKEKLDGANKNDPMQRMQYARALQMKGKNKEALAEYLWCFDHGLEHSMGFTGVRLSFLLGDIARLGAVYAPALDELRKRRDDAEKALLAPPKRQGGDGIGAMFFGGGASERAMEVAAINRELGDDARTLVVFDKLADRKDAALLRKMMLREVIDALLEAKRYDDILAAVGDPAEEVNRNIQSYQISAAMQKSRPRVGGPDPDRSYKHFIVAHCSKFYQAALGAQKPKKAAKLADQLISFDPSEDTFVDLAQRAVRVGDYSAARGIVLRGQETLDAEDRSRLDKIATRIPDNAN